MPVARISRLAVTLRPAASASCVRDTRPRRRRSRRAGSTRWSRRSAGMRFFGRGAVAGGVTAGRLSVHATHGCCRPCPLSRRPSAHAQALDELAGVHTSGVVSPASSRSRSPLTIASTLSACAATPDRRPRPPGRPRTSGRVRATSAAGGCLQRGGGSACPTCWRRSRGSAARAFTKPGLRRTRSGSRRHRTNPAAEWPTFRFLDPVHSWAPGASERCGAPPCAPVRRRWGADASPTTLRPSTGAPRCRPRVEPGGRAVDSAVAQLGRFSEAQARRRAPWRPGAPASERRPWSWRCVRGSGRCRGR